MRLLESSKFKKKSHNNELHPLRKSHVGITERVHRCSSHSVVLRFSLCDIMFLAVLVWSVNLRCQLALAPHVQWS